MTCTSYGCITPCGAFPVGCPSVVIEIEPFISIDDQANRTALSAKTSFDHLKSKISHLTFFPTHATPFTQLIYLAGLHEGQSPFSEEECLVLQRAEMADRVTKIWLRIGFAFAVATPVITWALDVNTPTAIFFNTVASVVSWVATGSNPDFKSDSANVRQDALYQHSQVIEKINRRLKDLYRTDQSLAEEIASHYRKGG